jgi:hypothetical protein
MAPGYWTRSLRTMSAGCGQAPGPSTAKPDVKMAREKPEIGGNLLRDPKLGGASLPRRPDYCRDKRSDVPAYRAGRLRFSAGRENGASRERRPG